MPPSPAPLPEQPTGEHDRATSPSTEDRDCIVALREEVRRLEARTLVLSAAVGGGFLGMVVMAIVEGLTT